MAISYNGYNEYGHAERGYCKDCGKGCTYHALERCKYCYEKATSPTAAINIERQIELSEKHTLELMAKKEAMDQFGKDQDFDVDDAILFKRQFKTGGPTYTYVAVKTPVGWYITGKDAHIGITFAELVETYLIKSDEVWNCTEWTQVV